jgi:hypothetical protein
VPRSTVVLVAVLLSALGCAEPDAPVASRLADAPIVSSDLLPGADGENINGPSLIRAPDWLPGRLGRYYLYFAHHDGGYIRLAVADSLAGPWRIHAPGTLRLEQTGCDQPGHLASPDVHVDDAAHEIRMYFHCPAGFASQVACPRLRAQVSFVARSRDGLQFTAEDEPLGNPYFRVFRRDGAWYALSQPGFLYRSRDGLRGFARGPQLVEPAMRHAALALRGDALDVFYSRIGDAPERILVARVDLRGDWQQWRAWPSRDVLAPERPWEGGSLALEPSQRGAAYAPVRQLRDPAIFEEHGSRYLLYSAAGERGIGIARLSVASTGFSIGFAR